MRATFLLLMALSLSACSTRVEYQRAAVPVTADAININTATAAELERLPQIGEKTAAAIIEFRTQNGRFRRLEQLMLIRGVSERRFLEIRPYLKAE